MTIRERIDHYSLPVDQVIVAGNGLLDHLGIRKSDDLDVVASGQLFEELSTQPGCEVGSADGDDFCRRPGLEVFRTWFGKSYADLLPSTEMIDDVRHLDVQTLKQWKKDLGREKELADIKLLEEYFERQ